MNLKRVDPQQAADERTAVREWLEYHRATLLMKIDGLTDTQARTRAIPSSNLSLLGLLRHMVVVERYWFTWVIGGVRPEPIYITWEDENLDFNFDDSATLDEAMNSYMVELNTSRGFEVGSLDTLAATTEVREGADFRPDLRWVMLHMIEEYARHNGHADLLREAIDGTRGD
jgi:uncharacterized damage-inducible protein DinB